MSVYKKFSPLDYATVPFNAHKQYTFNSSSAVSNQITVFDTRWTSESISTYSGNSGNNDSINAIKYQQLDHLYYRNFKRDVNNRLGDNHYLKQRRVLYENANILSIPAGLYGHQVKPGSFFLSSSNRKIVDDKNGNLIIEGTNISNYITDPRANVLNIGPVKGFKRYDLNTIEGYLNDTYYRDGEVNPDQVTSYSTPDRSGDEFDDSYYFNILEYKDVTFSEKSLFDFDEFPGINFNGSSSEVRIGHDDKFNYNKGDDFTLMFFLGENETGDIINSAGVTNYILAKSTTKTIIPTPSEGTAGIKRLQSTGSSQPIDIFSEPQYPFEVYLEHADNSPHIFFRRSDGEITTTISASFNTSSTDRTQLPINNQTEDIYITSSLTDSFHQINHGLHGVLDGNNTNVLCFDNIGSSVEFTDGGDDDHPNSVQNGGTGRDIKLDFDMFGMTDGESPIITEIELEFEDYVGHGRVQISGSNNGTTWTSISQEADSLSNIPGRDEYAPDTFQIEPIRLFKFPNLTGFKWYRLRFEENGFNNSSNYDTNTNQFTSIINPITVTDFQINSLKFFEGNRQPHITCRASSSQMQIFVDGILTGTSGSDNSINQTQNTANLYIGNKGGKTNHFTGSLSQINIFNRALTDVQVENHFKSSDGSPYVGNIFYSSGIVAITQPGVEESALATLGLGEMIIGENFIIDPNSEEGKAFVAINQLKFQGSHLIYEHEYQCTLDEYEFTDTLNPSARKIRSHQSADLADFATGSLFRPYITTVGLYNENNELLVVGKLGQPIRTSDETDTTLIVRWDT